MPTLRLPFLYHVEVTRPRHRRPETFVVSDLADFDIPHVASAEAPVAVTWTQNDSVLKYPDHFRGKPVPRVVARTWEGRSYLPLGEDATAGDAREFEASVTRPGRRSGGRGTDWSAFRYPSQDRFGHDHDAPRVKGCSTGDLDALLRDIEAGRQRVGKDDRAASMNAALESFRSRLLVVDGGIWSSERFVEPHYVVVDGGNGIELDVAMTSDPLSYCHPFRADRRDDALAWARGLADASGRDQAGIKVTADTLDVTDPAALAFDDGVGIARQMLSSFPKWGDGLAPGPLRDRVQALEAEVAALARQARAVPPAGELAWAAHALEACRELRGVLAGDGLDMVDVRGSFHRPFIALDRWEAAERDRRPDMVELGRFARGADDQVMASFTP